MILTSVVHGHAFAWRWRTRGKRDMVHFVQPRSILRPAAALNDRSETIMARTGRNDVICNALPADCPEIFHAAFWPHCWHELVSAGAVLMETGKRICISCSLVTLLRRFANSAILMATDILTTFTGYLIAPIVIVIALAFFIHCILTLHRTRERRALFFDTLLTAPTFRALPTTEESSLV